MPTRPPVHRPTGWRPPAMVRAEADKRRPNANRRGYDAEWEALRKEVLAERSCCESPGCGSTDRLNVHHIVSIRRAPHRRLDRTNLRVLCHACHSRHTALHDGGFGH